MKTITFYSETEFDTNKPESEAGTGRLPLKKDLVRFDIRKHNVHIYLRFLPVYNEILRKNTNTGNLVIPA